MRALITGATGAIGIPVVRRLLAERWCVTALVRRDLPGEESQRLFHGCVGTITGDVTSPLCGIAPDTVADLHGHFDVLIHAAGKTQYFESLREETFHANVGGTRHALELSQALGIPYFVYVSTCYVAGRSAYLGEVECGRPDEAHNPYEASKVEAESLVRAHKGRTLILRLSTVIGDSRVGEVANAGGYAAFVGGFWVARDRLRRYRENPFWVGLNPESTLNLIPNDWVAEHMAKAIGAGMSGTIHLAHPEPVRMGWLFDLSVQKLDLPLTYRRVEAERTARWHDPLWRKIQDSITKGIVGYFGPYVMRDTTFGLDRATQIPSYRLPPTISAQILDVQLDYMMNNLFQRKRVDHRERPAQQNLPA